MRRARRAALVGAVVWGAFGACSPAVPEGEGYSEARLLDERCAADACRLEGSARRVQGLTPDSLAYELGPLPGKLSIPVASALTTPGDTYGAMALMKGEGTLGSRSVPSEYAWQAIGLDAQKRVATIEVADGSHVTVVDIRIVRYYSTPGCS